MKAASPEELGEPLPPPVTRGACFCGSFRVQLSGEPVVRATCEPSATAACAAREWGGGAGEEQATASAGRLWRPPHPACGGAMGPVRHGVMSSVSSEEAARFSSTVLSLT